jgi:hypothetical protein
MATVGVKEILSYLSLCGMIQTNVPTVPRRLPEKFYKTQGEKVEGDAGRYTRFTSSRAPISFNEYYAPSKARDLRPVGQMDIKLFHAHEHLSFNGQVLEAMRNFTDYNLQEKGKDWVAKQMEDARTAVEIGEDLTALFVLCKGKVWQDSKGKMLPSSSGAFMTHDFGINQSTNVGTIGAVTGVTGSWSSPATQIPLQLESLRIKAQQQHGYIPTTLLYGKNIPTMLAQNDFVSPFLSRNEKRNEGWLNGKFPSATYNLFDFDWYPIADAGFNDIATGVYQLPIGDNDLIACPDPDNSWWDKLEGSYLVPSNLNVIQSMEGAVAALEKIYGRFAYSKLMDDPVQITAHYGNTWTYVIKNPDVVYQMTV